MHQHHDALTDSLAIGRAELNSHFVVCEAALMRFSEPSDYQNHEYFRQFLFVGTYYHDISFKMLCFISIPSEHLRRVPTAHSVHCELVVLN
mmetsp:Transcript_52199/g.136459  ORF Transcript_52199/g.136459 Transcript_52199/m.136459 type:complete len:91 (-) Transcript_52199:2-274(-)